MHISTIALTLFSLVPSTLAGEPEKLYLTNCNGNGAAGLYLRSQMAWYPAGAGSSNGEVPANGNEAGVSQFQYVVWENSTQVGYFQSATADSHIDVGANNLPLNA